MALLMHVWCAAALALSSPAVARGGDRPGLAHVTAYADVADLALAAPVVIVARIHATVRVSRRAAPGLAEGARRYLVHANVDRAILAPGPVPGRIEYLWDVQSPDRPDIDDRPVILFLAPVPGRTDQFRLVKPNAQVAADAGLEARVRTILKEARGPAAPSAKAVAVTRAFTVPGAVPGEAETQIFLQAQGAQPTSLVVLSRPGEPKRWTASFGDTIDTDAPAIKRDTLAWYALACGLPRALPADATAELDEGERATVAADYAFVLKDLGPCRTPKDASSTPTDKVSG